MNDQNLPDRIKATLTIELDFAKVDQPLIHGILQQIIDNLGISSSGNGSATASSHYSYNVESNLPKQPMTMDRILDLADAAGAPGQPTARERIAESMRPDYEQALEWWEGLSEAQQLWFIEKHPTAQLVTSAWDINRELPFADRALLDALK